jgi:hypothetical protein
MLVKISQIKLLDLKFFHHSCLNYNQFSQTKFILNSIGFELFYFQVHLT